MNTKKQKPTTCLNLRGTLEIPDLSHFTLIYIFPSTMRLSINCLTSTKQYKIMINQRQIVLKKMVML